MGSLLSPMITDFFIEAFENRDLDKAPLKLLLYQRYVDDTLMVWMHGREPLDSLVLHLNSMSESLQFVVELEKEGQLPFLDSLIKCEVNGSLSRTVHGKPTHNDLYLNSWSHCSLIHPLWHATCPPPISRLDI